MILVNSYGGCANTLLIEQLKIHNAKLVFDGTDFSSKCKKFKHIKIPPPALLNENHLDGVQVNITGAIYLFSDPIEAIITFYRRRQEGVDSRGPIQNWVTGHCFNIGGSWEALSPEWDITDYARQREDLLCLTEHFFNWQNAKVGYPILFVKYDELWESLDIIANFSNIEATPFTKQFPEKRQRQFCESNIPEEAQTFLTETYSELIAAVSDAEPTWRKDAFYK